MAAVDRVPGDAALWCRAAHGDHDAFGQLTGTGMISAGFTAPPQQIFARSGIGSVAIRVPSGTAYRVAASTQEGSVRVSVPRAAASSHVIQATTGTGTVTVTGS